MYITLHESHGGLSRSGEYYFIVEGNRLIHISYYAVFQRRLYEDMVEYTIDLDRLRGKKVVEIRASNSGIFCNAYIYPAEDLPLKYDQRREERQPLSYLNDFEFAHLTDGEKRFLQTDWRQYYIPMIEELRMFSATAKSINPDFPYVFLTRLIACQIEGQANYPLSFLIPYSEYARGRSLEGLSKEIHQLWVVTRIITELARLKWLNDIYLNFEQSSYRAIASFYCKDGLCSLWYEFDMNPHTMCKGMLWYRSTSDMLREFYERVKVVLIRRRLRRIPLRPDIAILRGGESCDELVEGFKVKMIIECKNQDYEYWSKDINDQVVPYKEIFQPDIVVLVSLKKIPDHIKAWLEKYGIIIVDEVYPKGSGERELLQLIRSIIH